MSEQVLVGSTVREGPRASEALRARRAVAAATRRRRVLVVLVSVAAVLAGAGAAVPALLWAAGGVVALTAAYLALVARVRHLAVEREMAMAFSGPEGGFDWQAFEAATPSAGDGAAPIAQPGAHRFALARFVAAYLVGWALTPVAIAIRLLAGDRRDLTGDGVLARLVALQRRSRAHSLRALAVSVATTAGVSAVGGLTGLAASATAASAAPAPGVYTVAAGDTLGSIAAAHGTTVAAVAAANHLADPNLIYVGQQLVLPAATATPSGSPAASSGTYTVAAGDTLGSIAAAHGTTVAALVAANHIADPNVIYVGQVLDLAPATPGATPAAPAPASATPSGGSGTYTVVAGDTLGSIAARYGTTVAVLAAANHIADPNVIYVGEVLAVSGTAAAAPAAGPAAAPPAVPAGSASAAKALSVALAQVGKPYQWAGAGPSTFDCSGLVMYAYEAAGISLPHYTVSQYQDTARITEAQLEPGDLVFYGGFAPSHVAMYAGGGRVVTADTTGTPVRVESITWDGTPSGFGRVG